MSEFRKRSEVVDAVQLDTLDHQMSAGALEFMGAPPGQFEMPLVAGKACWWRQSFLNGPDKPPSYSLIVYTKHGEVEAVHGDWIVKSAKGELWVCGNEEFSENYEPVPTPPPGE